MDQLLKLTTIKLIPLLFQTEMIQALIKGWKTWTRRLKALEEINKDPDKWDRHSLLKEEGNNLFCCFLKRGSGKIKMIKCPYGKPGNVIWVRESFYQYGYWAKTQTGDIAPDCGENYWTPAKDKPIYYLADEKRLPLLITDQPSGNRPKKSSFYRKKPGIHMPFAAARIFLRIKSIKVERLKDISAAEAIGEGIYRWNTADEYFEHLHTLPAETTKYAFANELHLREKIGTSTIYQQYVESIFVPDHLAATTSAKDSFIGLFLSINEQRDFDYNSPLNNPWVWCIEFEVLSTTGNPDSELYKLPEKAKKYSRKTTKNIPS